MVPGPESIEEISSCEAGLRAERATPRAVAGAHRRRKGTLFGFRIGRVAGFPSTAQFSAMSTKTPEQYSGSSADYSSISQQGS